MNSSNKFFSENEPCETANTLSNWQNRKKNWLDWDNISLFLLLRLVQHIISTIEILPSKIGHQVASAFLNSRCWVKNQQKDCSFPILFLRFSRTFTFKNHFLFSYTKSKAHQTMIKVWETFVNSLRFPPYVLMSFLRAPSLKLPYHNMGLIVDINLQ